MHSCGGAAEKSFPTDSFRPARPARSSPQAAETHHGRHPSRPATENRPPTPPRGSPAAHGYTNPLPSAKRSANPRLEWRILQIVQAHASPALQFDSKPDIRTRSPLPGRTLHKQESICSCWCTESRRSQRLAERARAQKLQRSPTVPFRPAQPLPACTKYPSVTRNR